MLIKLTNRSLKQLNQAPNLSISNEKEMPSDPDNDILQVVFFLRQTMGGHHIKIFFKKGSRALSLVMATLQPEVVFFFFEKHVYG